MSDFGSQSPIEEALGDEVAAVLPEAIRLVELRARMPRGVHARARQNVDGHIHA